MQGHRKSIRILVLGEREWSHVNKLTNQKQFWFLLSGGKNASFLTCWGATQRLPGCNSGSEPALLPSPGIDEYSKYGGPGAV